MNSTELHLDELAMRLATRKERNAALKNLKLDATWLAPGCRANWQNRHLFDDPGYVLKFESAPWTENVLIVSEPIGMPNVVDNQRCPRIDVHANDSRDRKPKCSSWYARNVILLREGKVVFRKKNATLAAPGLGMPEWPRFFAFHSTFSSFTTYVILPDESLKYGSIKLPGLRVSQQNFILGSGTYFRMALQLGISVEWKGVVAMTRRSLKRR